jgi:hypothetical protein
MRIAHQTPLAGPGIALAASREGAKNLSDDERHDQTIASEILNYFLRNPHAVDSLEGVARWRLMEDLVRRKLDETEAALRWLVEEGYLTTSVSPGSTAMFRLNPERVEQARQFLAVSAARARTRPQ